MVEEEEGEQQEQVELEEEQGAAAAEVKLVNLYLRHSCLQMWIFMALLNILYIYLKL